MTCPVHTKNKEILEEMVDLHGLRRVIEALGDIMAEKAEHVRVNWQDNHGGKELDKEALKLHRFAPKVRE